MDMNEKPGQPSMEEILASIRRIIAEEPAEPLPVASLQNGSHAPASSGLIDEGSEFELPSMFRPSAGTSQPERPAALFGRLTDAIRNSAPEAKAPAPQQAPAGEAEPQQAAAAASAFAPAQTAPAQSIAQSLSQLDALVAASAALPSLSSLRTVRQEAPPADRPAEATHHQAFPMPVAAPVAPTSVPVAAPTVQEPVRREMVAFKDTRFMRMSSPTSVVIETAAAPAPATPIAAFASAPAVAAFPTHPTLEVPHVEIPVVAPVAASAPAATQPPGAQVDGVLAMLIDLKKDIEALKREQAGLPHFEPVLQTYVPAPLYHAPEPAMHWAPPAHQLPSSPPPIAPVDTAAGNGSIEDTTAELLRPMLRAWLSENMPRMVEKALHIEVADSVKLSRKPG